jgi:hypothetical protein
MKEEVKAAKAPKQKAPESVTPVLDGAFELVGIKPIKINTGYGNFDLGNLTTTQAEFLVSKGFKFIVKK